MIFRLPCLMLATTFLLLPRSRAQSVAAPASAPAVAAETLLPDVARQLAGHFHLEGDLQLSLTRPVTLPDVPADRPLRLIVTDFTSTPASSMLVRCRLEAGGAPLSSVTLMVHAELWADVWVARLPLVADAPFDPSELNVERADLLRERAALPASAGGADFAFARSIPAGQTLVWRYLKRRPLVHRGDTIDVSAVDGPLTVTVKALAVQDGGRGETVLVRNLVTRKEFSAVVVDDGRAQIRL